jgi:hypothetical protein
MGDDRVGPMVSGIIPLNGNGLGIRREGGTIVALVIPGNQNAARNADYRTTASSLTLLGGKKDNV